MFSVKIGCMRSARLMSLLLLLQTHERMTSKELADRFEVSQRTILRDVEALSAAGVPVHTERGRHGAIVLDRRARLDPARLDPAEVQLLTLAGMTPQQLRSVGLHAVNARAQEKLAAIAARAPRAAAQPPLSDVVLIDPAGWFVPSQEVDLSGLLDAARSRHRVRVRYRHSGRPVGRWVTVDPYGVACKATTWYLVGDVDGEPRLFNTSRIEAHHTVTDTAVLRPGQDLRSVWATLLADFPSAPMVEVRALLRSSRLDMARRILGTRLASVTATDAQWSSIVVQYPDVESVRQLLQFADHIRVLAPRDAVERVHSLAVELAHNHPASGSGSASGRDRLPAEDGAAGLLTRGPTRE